LAFHRRCFERLARWHWLRDSKEYLRESACIRGKNLPLYRTPLTFEFATHAGSGDCPERCHPIGP
jgi:hypothetical protein